MNTKEKEVYVAPEIDFFLLEIDQGIAAGSARVIPPDSGSNVQEKWNIDSDDDRTIEWQNL